MQTQASGDLRCGIGARLRTARERTGLTPLQAAERLHLDPDVIAALETETFESLGAPVYVRGHLKRYAELVGERAGELQESYAASAQSTELPDLTRIAKRAPTPHRRTLATLGMAIALGIALIGVSWWALRAIRTTAIPIAASVLGPQSVPPSTKAASAPPATPEEDVSVTTSSPQSASAPAASVPVRVAPRMSALTLRFTEDSWVEVYDANGARLFYDIGAAGITRTLNGAAPLRIVLGNAGGVTVEFNGRATTIPEFAIRDDGQARFVVNRSGRVVRSRLASGGVSQ
jgi:cytoskeleton protein RodZ